MPRLFQIAHKKQTKMFDCWYACIQMVKTHARNGHKCKPIGAAVENKRSGSINLLGEKLYRQDHEFNEIIRVNHLKHLYGRPFTTGGPISLNGVADIEAILNVHGPLIILGDFCSFLGTRWGHFIVVSGVDRARDLVHVNDPNEDGPTDMRFVDFDRNVYTYGNQVVLASALRLDLRALATAAQPVGAPAASGGA